MYQEENYNTKIKTASYIVILMSILFLILFFVCVTPVDAAQTLNSSVNLTQITKNSLTFQVVYKNSVRATGATFDGVEIAGFDLLHSLNYTVSELEPNTTHEFCIYKDLYNCEKGTTQKDDLNINLNFYIALLIGIICVICATLINRMIGFIGFMMGAYLTMVSFDTMDGFALVAGNLIAIASIMAVFWGKGD